MTFDEAIRNAVTYGDDTKGGATFYISYEGNRNRGYATLLAQYYSREKEETIATVKKAWERFCKDDPEKCQSITKIEIVTDCALEKTGKKKTA